MKKYIDLYFMLKSQQILLNIKQQVLEVFPEADIYLFGSRVNGNPTSESDWDILIITDREKVLPKMKQAVHDRVFPLSVALGSFVNFLIVTKTDWTNSPVFYSLKNSIGKNSLAL